MSDEQRWQPVPVPLGDGRHDVGDAVRAAIAQRLIEDFGRVPDLTPHQVHHLALFAAASVRSLLHEFGTLRDMSAEPTVEQAFKAGYHCQWIRDEWRYVFDPAMKPGDSDGAYRAWSLAVVRSGADDGSAR